MKEESQEKEISAHELIRIILSYPRFIIWTVVGVTFFSILYAVFWPSTYQAMTSVQVPDSSLTAIGMIRDLAPELSKTGDPLLTYVDIAQCDTVAYRVLVALKLRQNTEYENIFGQVQSDQKIIEKLDKNVSVDDADKSNLITITVKSHDPKLAAKLANTWAKIFVEFNLEISHVEASSRSEFLQKQAEEVESRLNNPNLQLNEKSKTDTVIYDQILESLQQSRMDEAVDDAGIVVVDKAPVPDEASWPKPLIVIALGLVLGFLLGVQGAYFFDRFRNKVADEETLKRVAKIPNLASIPDFREDYPKTLNPPLLSERFSSKALISNPVFVHSFYRESFKVLRTNLMLSQAGEQPRAIAILSPGPSEGKTLSNSNLAISLANTGKSVILIDADLRKSSVGKIFNTNRSQKIGLPLVLTGQGNWRDMVQPSGVEHLDLLPNTVIPPNPAELLGSDLVKKLILELKKAYDYVVFDGAPILPVTDSVVLATALDGVVLMARWDSTRVSEFAKAYDHLKAVRASVLGSLLNHVQSRKGLYAYGYGDGGYRRYYQEESNEKAELSKK